MLDRFTILAIFSGLLVAYIFWMDFRPYWRNRSLQNIDFGKLTLREKLEHVLTLADRGGLGSDAHNYCLIIDTKLAEEGLDVYKTFFEPKVENYLNDRLRLYRFIAPLIDDIPADQLEAMAAVNNYLDGKPVAISKEEAQRLLDTLTSSKKAKEIT